MPLLKKVLFSLLISVSLGLIFLTANQFLSLEKSKVLPIKTQTGTVPNVYARVGEYMIKIISGWASPYAEVNLTGQGINRKTIADENGYFEFTDIPLRGDYEELCLTSIDVNHLVTLPVCLPPVLLDQNIEITGIILPPTFSLERGYITTGESTKASGLTFPNSLLDVYIFENKQRFLPSIFNPFLAKGLPRYQVNSNENGFFEFSMPGAEMGKIRLFVNSFFQSDKLKDSQGLPLSPSPQSNLLSLTILGKFWFWLICFLLFLFILAFFLLFPWGDKNRQLVIFRPYCETKIP